ncbi:MAG: CsbD family protein [Comamonadaceae bacterium]|nr:MAG: CsbD family protein [Comamonadaceae bacterium]
MNKHQVEGRVDQSTGKVKEIAGRVVGNERLEAEGQLDQAKGKAQATYGDTKESAKDKAKDAIDKL